MTPEDWNASTDVAAMLAFLANEGLLNQRKARLFCVALCRRIWPSLTDRRSQDAVEVAERYADGLVTEEERRKAHDAADEVAEDLYNAAADETGEADVDDPIAHAAGAAALTVIEYDLTSDVGLQVPPEEMAREVSAHAAAVGVDGQTQANVLRDLFGDPFQPLLLRANDTAMLKAAEATYEKRLPDGRLDPARVADLADALEAAGCRDTSLFEHLGLHYRGCHVVDVLLGRGRSS